MSRLIKKPINIPAGVTVAQNGAVLDVKGPKGELHVKLAPGVTVKIEGADLNVSAGTEWSLSRNAIEGVTTGFLKVLEIEGVGYRAMVEGKELVLHLGYAQPVRVSVLPGITVAVEKSTIKVSGIDKDLVGRMAAEIRALKKPEPYKGKGIHYQGEVIRRKVGKKAGATAST
ncbi:MAG TPA: 50S ribosomal protein L6 [Candidatus Paceibacterota bacterium]|nr:50S ribosomal protein L6 [Candidatus Paceibacterota bacterium]